MTFKGGSAFRTAFLFFKSPFSARLKQNILAERHLLVIQILFFINLHFLSQKK